MLFKRFVFVLIPVLLLMAGCGNESSDIERSRDPWVFRINLDDRPRMIGLALNDEMWAAYDGQHAGLYKVWKGDVKFTGPVFDNIHAVQPGSRGPAYLVDSLEASVWRISRAGEETSVTAKYTGYQRESNQVTLQFEIPLETGQTISVYETPEYVVDEFGNPGFERRFTTSGVPDNVKVLLDLQLQGLLEDGGIDTDGKYSKRSAESRIENGQNYSSENGTLELNHNTSTYFRSYFAAIEDDQLVEADDLQKASASAVQDDELAVDLRDPIARGKVVIAEGDCAACHRLNEAQIGPSYAMIARKYEDNEQTIKQLAGKIISGGKGVWGDRPMSPHPDVSQEDAVAMASYILSLGGEGGSEVQPGVAVDFYEIGLPLASLPVVVAGQSPNQSMTFPQVGFYSGNPDIGEDEDENFAGFKNDFVMHVNGYLNIPKAGKYHFRFVANNGGKWYLDDKLISSGHYYEGTYIDEKTLTLEAGPHPFRMEHYHHLFDKALFLQWRRNNSEEYETIPAEFYTHDPLEIKPSSPGLKEIYRTSAPGFGASLEAVHPSFDLSPVRPDGFEPRVGDLDFDDDGSLVICTWDGEVYRMTGVTDSDPANVTVTKMADGLCEPLGIAAVEGEVYVLQRWELTHLIDADKDGVAEEYRVLADDWQSKADFHEWSFGLPYRDGYFYATLGIGQSEIAYPQAEDRGKMMKIHRETGEVSFIAHGLREANGVGFSADGEIFTTDNEGTFVPVCKVIHVPQDGYSFFGNYEVLGEILPEYKEMPPAIWLPQNEIGNSPSQPITIEAGPYKGQLIHGEVTHGGIKRDFIEKVKGVYQGAVMRFSQGLEVGINRMEWGPDGALYVAGLGGNQDFGHKGHQFGLQRLTYNGKTTFEMLAVRARANGFEIEFTEPIRIGDGTDPQDYLIQQWWYEASEEYGGGKKDLENLPVRSVTVSEDRRTVFLELQGLKEEHVVYVNLRTPMLSETNQQLWSNQAWYTLNRIPDLRGQVGPSARHIADNTLLASEVAAGWKLLFDGKTSKSWSDVENRSLPAGWAISGGNLKSVSGSKAIVSAETYQDFELELEWRITPGSEAAVFYGVQSEKAKNALTESAYRMQLIDDLNHADAQIKTHLSGANFDLQAPRYRIAKPAGEYNHSRLMVKGNSVEHWLNGIKVVEYTIGSAEWQAQVAQSIYADNPDFGKTNEGHISLQCFEGEVFFKNIRLREIDGQALHATHSEESLDE